ncbi:MAG: hypothetical protein KF777_14785 [Planctomycetaceae bacterium]|jgi:hypothetical protein|nr:hypothetical protein [Planctomycetaceae bacterium]
MPPRSSESGNPTPDAYVGLLFVSLAALLTGIIFLFLELSDYGFKIAP